MNRSCNLGNLEATFSRRMWNSSFLTSPSVSDEEIRSIISTFLGGNFRPRGVITVRRISILTVDAIFLSYLVVFSLKYVPLQFFFHWRSISLLFVVVDVVSELRRRQSAPFIQSTLTLTKSHDDESSVSQNSVMCI